MCRVHAVCAGMHRCAGVRGYAQVYMGVRKYAQVHTGVHGCVCVCGRGVCVEMFRCIWYAWVCTGMCGMNFQNSYWRLES